MNSATDFLFSNYQEYRETDYGLPGTITWDSDEGFFDFGPVDSEQSAFFGQCTHSMPQSNSSGSNTIADTSSSDIGELLRAYDTTMECFFEKYPTYATEELVANDATFTFTSSFPGLPSEPPFTMSSESPVLSVTTNADNSALTDSEVLENQSSSDNSEFLLALTIAIQSMFPSPPTPALPEDRPPSGGSEFLPGFTFGLQNPTPPTSADPLETRASAVSHTADVPTPSSPLPTCIPPSHLEAPRLWNSSPSSLQSPRSVSPLSSISSRLSTPDPDDNSSETLSSVLYPATEFLPSSPLIQCEPSPHLNVPKNSQQWPSQFSRSPSPLSSVPSRVSTPDLNRLSETSSSANVHAVNAQSTPPSPLVPRFLSPSHCLQIPRISLRSPSSLQSSRHGSPPSSAFTSRATTPELDEKDHKVRVPSLSRRPSPYPYNMFGPKRSRNAKKKSSRRGTRKYTFDDDDYHYHSDGEVDYEWSSFKSFKRMLDRRCHREPLRERTCRQCGAVFTRGADLARHKETVHKVMAETNMENSKCTYCTSVLARPDAKKRHEEARPKKCRWAAYQRVQDGELDLLAFEQHFGPLPEDIIFDT